METSLKIGFAQIFSCCPKNLSCPNFGGAAAPLAPPARTPMRGLNRGFMVTRIEQLVPKYSLTGGFLRRLKTNMKHCETSFYIPNWHFFGCVCGTGAELSVEALCAAPCARWNHTFILLKKVGATKLIKTDLWLWRWLPHRLSKRQSLSTKTTVQ